MKKMINDSELKIEQLITDIHNTEMSRIPENKILKDKYHLSDTFYQKMNSLLKKVDKKEKRIIYSKYIAAVASIIFVLGALSHPQYLVEAKDSIVEWFQNHVNIHFEKEDITIIPHFELGYIPEGYEQVIDEYYAEGMGVIAYENENKEFSLSYEFSSSDLNLNNEGVEFSTFRLDDGMVIFYFESVEEGTDSTMTWLSKDDNVVFTLIGTLSKDEMIKIVINLQKLQ